MTQPNVRLESISFDGPFELLFALIEKKEYDIYDIPISKLADQYIEYINSINIYDMDNMSEFLLMAATLLEIKSRMLIPRPTVEKHDDETDPRDELVKRLVEYKRFKEVTEVLRDKEEDASRRFFRLTDPDLSNLVKHIESSSRLNNADIGDILNGVTLESLYKVFEDVVNRRETAPSNEIRITPIDSDNFTIEGKIDYISSLLLQNKQISFAKVFEGCVSKIEKVVTFLAVLELMRMLKVKARQDNVFGEIYLSLNKDIFVTVVE